MNVEGYCLQCRKKLFDGAKVPVQLPFNAPTLDNLAEYQQRTKRLSISGVQLKYSLRLEDKELKLVETGGQYIIKPIPPGILLQYPEIAPENEHLTMQIAEQVFDIKTAGNALIYFNDGVPAYITRRFDVKPDGKKYLQEDMAQLSIRSKHTAQPGEDFKYGGTYEEIGVLIKQYVAAYPPALEQLFKLVLFNYIFSNGDAHLKNFSLIETVMGDYALSPAYDLMCTLLHIPNENDMALDLYQGCYNSEFYGSYGFFGQPDFRIFAGKLGIQPIRVQRLLTQMLISRTEVIALIENSFLPDEQKRTYIGKYEERLRRLGMTEQMIAAVINPKYPGVYAPTSKPVVLTFMNHSVVAGFFETTPDSEKLKQENKYTFATAADARQYQKNRADNLITIIDADELIKVQFAEDH
jgi:serine/threonine-protein kinase HipA